MLASLATLKGCIINCPKDQFNARHNDYPFSQVIFHAVFYCDYYLSKGEEEFFQQYFHKENKSTFDDYEELEDRLPTKLYTYDFLISYINHCKVKIENVFSKIGEEELSERPAIRKDLNSRMELFIYVIRHIQHHAAQLGLRIQMVTKEEMKWIKRGWK